ncbi:hypothetical protein OROMI_020990 [Orobanche minor]
MKYLSEKCEEDCVSKMYGFFDSHYLSHSTSMEDKEERSDYLARIFGQNEGKNANQLFFAPYYANYHWMLAAISPWNGVVFCLDPTGVEKNIHEHVQQIINEGITKFSEKYRTDVKKFDKNNPRIRWIKTQYFGGANVSFPQVKIDKLRDMWIEYVNEHKQVVDEELDDGMNGI